MKVKFELERETKNTMRFQEIVLSKFDTPEIGTLYVQKNCLKKIGYKDGDSLVVEIGVNKEEVVDNVR